MILGSDILLLPLNKADNVQGRIPGKLFEYMYARKLIWVFGPQPTDVNDIVTKTGLGFSTNYGDVKLIKSRLVNFIKNRSNTIVNPTSIDEYSIVSLTETIATYLDEITTKH